MVERLDKFFPPLMTEAHQVAASSQRLYTRRVIGEEMLSSTSAFNLNHSEALSATTSSFIL